METVSLIKSLLWYFSHGDNMNNNKGSSVRTILVVFALVSFACICVLSLAGVGYWLYVRPQQIVTTRPTVVVENEETDTTNTGDTSTTSDETTTDTTESATPSPEAITANTPETAEATEAPATLPMVEPTSPPTPSPGPTSTATPLEPTLLPTETATPTRPAGPGIPAPRLVNHTNCQNNISQFGRNATIEFSWTWTQRVNTEEGNYLEVRVGPRGATNLASTGAINNDALRDPAQNLWSVSIPVSTFYQDTANDYEWQVAYMNDSQRVIVASGRGCFNIR
jgi:cytoskeletal protein RodZ